MFPFSHYSNTLMPFETYSPTACQNPNFNSTFNPYGNYFYFSPPSIYQPNVNYVPLLQPTLFTDASFHNFKAFQEGQNQKNVKNSLEKNSSSSTAEQKIIYEKTKTKMIQKNKRELQMLAYSQSLKSKKQKSESKYNESEYSAEEQIKKKTEDHLHLYLKYRRKNTESNIVNRIYSFLTSQFKNRQQFPKLKLSEAQKETYIKYLLVIADAWKGPIKRQLLHGMMYVTQSLPGFKVLQKMFESQRILSLEQFGYLNRILIRTYLSKIAAISVITSKKMKKGVWKQHLQKIRELNQYFFQFQKTSS